MTLLGLFALCFPAVIGAVAARILWPAPPRAGWRDAIFLFCLGWPLGWGLTAAIFFIWSLAVARPALPSALTDLMLALFLVKRALRARLTSDRFKPGRSIPTPSDPSPAAPQSAHPLALAALITLFAQLALVALVVSIRAAQVEPYGSWDGWAIWNFHARFIDRAATLWPALLQAPQVAWSHPDYPLLVPASVARLWGWMGRESPGGAAAVSLLFGIGTVGLLVTALHRRRGPIIALLAGIALLSTPFFVTFASNEHADIPLGLFILAALVLLAEPGSGADPKRLLLLGASIGLAASVKNEGQLFAAISALAWLGWVRRAGPTPAPVGPFLAGLALALAPLLYFKVCLAPPNDLAASHPADRVAALFAPARHRLILASLARDFVGFGQWKWVPFFPLILAAIGPGWKRLTRSEWSVAAVLVTTLGGYYAVFLLSPFDLQWHLDSSLVRLLMQLWPGALFVWGLAAAEPPAEASAKEGRPAPSLATPALIAVNLALAATLLLLFNRQLAPNELAATPFHAVHVVPAADWYPAETDGKSRWSWSSRASTMHLVAARGNGVRLRFAARGLQPQTLTVRRNGRVIWTASIGTRLAKYALPPVAAPCDLTFTSDRPGLPESSDARSRTLAFALYDVGIE